MIFSTLKLKSNEAIDTQLINHILKGIEIGELKKDSKLPSTREVISFLKISRNTVISAYEELEAMGIIITKRGRGTFISVDSKKKLQGYSIDWKDRVNYYGKTLRDMDVIKNELSFKKGMISFKSIAPDYSLFNLEDFKRAFLDCFSVEQANLLNYGYAKGYKPLIEYLFQYMQEKNVDTKNKDILITNGFTEAFDIIIETLTKENDIVVCEEPTHNTALKIMKSHKVKVIQIPMDKDGIKTEELKKAFKENKPAFLYLTPSYNNPTGIVMKALRRQEVYNIAKEFSVPIIEDGFNEELLYSSSPIEPLASLSKDGNSVIYIGSFSKILFPGLRIGWILGDKFLIDILESVKRGRNIHSSFLDQGCLYYYLKSGAFSKHVKSVRKYYREKYLLLMECVEKYLDYEYVTGEGGLHIFIKLKNNISARKLLDLCYKDNVIFMPGDVFFEEGKGHDTLRIGFGRVSNENIKKGIRLIGENLKKL